MSSISQPLVSIVTPVYNESKYLAQCIESVLAQSYQNWDYTIIDNCSTDGSWEIACNYAAKDRRIRVCRNAQFLNVIPNHNAALHQISSESKYCKVVLGDDWIFPDCLEHMVALAESHPSVGIVGAYALEGQNVVLSGLAYPSHRIDGREICRRHLLEGLYVFGSANAVLYRADLVRSRELFYDETNIHADTEVCFALLKRCDFGFVHRVLTFSRVRPMSLSTASKDLATDLSCLLRLLCLYGKDYLTDEEYEVRLAQHLSEYYRFLGKSLIRGRDKQFWNYHKMELARIGVGFSRSDLAKGVLATLYHAAINPKTIMTKLSRVSYKPGVGAGDFAS